MRRPAKCFLSTWIRTWLADFQQMLAALLSSGSNKLLNERVSPGHVSHTASGLGDSISQAVSVHPSALARVHASEQPNFQLPEHASSLASRPGKGTERTFSVWFQKLCLAFHWCLESLRLPGQSCKMFGMFPQLCPGAERFLARVLTWRLGFNKKSG